MERDAPQGEDGRDEEASEDERALDLELERDENPPEEIVLERDQALRDLRDLQELSIERASGRSSPPPQ